jgi:hypothetical protein
MKGKQMVDKATMMKEMMEIENVTEYRKSCAERYPLFDKYTSIRLPSMSTLKKDIGQNAFDGSGKPAKMPCITPSGCCTVDPIDPTMRWKMTSNVWRDTYFMTAKILTDEIGQDKADEYLAYLWYALAAKMEGFNKHFLKDMPRDCVTLSKAFQLEILIEGNDFDVVVETPEKAAVRFQCAWWHDFVKVWEPLGVDIREPLCNQGCTGWSKEWAQIFNPKISFTKTKYIGAGDGCCEFTWEMKE